MLGKIQFLVTAEIIVMAAPVSTSMVSCLSFTVSSTEIGFEHSSLMENNVSSSVSAVELPIDSSTC